MTERKPGDMSVESWIDKQIREAEQRGDFADLPGKGKPLPGYGSARHDENWWLRGYLEREGVPADTMLPTSLRLRKEAERLPETVRPLASEAAVRDVVAELNRRIVAHVRGGGGPRIPVAPVDVDGVVARWRASRPVPKDPEPVRSAVRVPWWRKIFGKST